MKDTVVAKFEGTLINARVAGIKESATLAVMTKAAQLKAQGKSIIDLSTGEPDIDTPEYIKEAAIKALRDGKTKYTSVAGIPDLREAIAEKLRRDNGIEATAQNIIVTNGGKQALHGILDVVLEPGDEVIIPAPFWVSFPSMVELSGGKSVIVKTKAANGYKMTPGELANAITERTKCVIFNSPSNPTGVGYTANEIRAIADVVAPHKILVISDEVYEKVTYDGFEFTSFAKAAPQLADRVVTVNAFSKSYSMTGWRLGYACGPKELIAAMIRHQSQTTSNINSFSQYAALAALKGSQEFIPKMVESFDRRIGMVMTAIKNGELPGITLVNKPQGAFYLFLRIDDLVAPKSGKARFAGSGAFAEFILEKAGVAIVAGEAFGDDAAFRISVGAADEQIKGAIERISGALRSLE